MANALGTKVLMTQHVEMWERKRQMSSHILCEGPLLAPEAILLALPSGGLQGSAKESGESFNAAFLSLSSQGFPQADLPCAGRAGN